MMRTCGAGMIVFENKGCYVYLISQSEAISHQNRQYIANQYFTHIHMQGLKTPNADQSLIT